MADSDYPSDTQFAGLVEAATAAADQEVRWSNEESLPNQNGRNHYEGHDGQGALENGYHTTQNGQYESTVRELRMEGLPGERSRPGPRKRKRGQESVSSSQGQSAERNVSEARNDDIHTKILQTAAAVHSAAALFREPSASSKKWTRPPMSKLYSSLEVSPENFLYLQAAAKAYMLDPNHPERRETVGQRGRGDGDMVKLRLWNCVKEFLHDLGNGDKFFGEHVPKNEGQPRSTIWPRDSQTIIKLCVPLLRRMVTNERQRQYAVESRKGPGDDDVRDCGGQGSPPSSLTSHSLGSLPKKEVLKLDIQDILGDGCVTGSYEASEWFDDYRRQGTLGELFETSNLSEKDFRILVANIDGHCRFFHHGDPTPCYDECEAETIDRLLAWEPLYQSRVPDGDDTRSTDPASFVRDLFHSIRTDIRNRDGWPDLRPRSQTTVKTINTRKTRHASSTNPAATTPLTTPETPSTHHFVSLSSPLGPSSGSPTGGPLKLHINLVISESPSTSSSTTSSSSNNNTLKRTHPRFTLASESVPDLHSLRAKIKKHYGPNPGPVAGTGDSQNPLFSVKVWLPDGLVQVRDDGEWAIALLSAGMVDWMDGEVRVLVEM